MKNKIPEYKEVIFDINDNIKKNEKKMSSKNFIINIKNQIKYKIIQ